MQEIRTARTPPKAMVWPTDQLTTPTTAPPNTAVSTSEIAGVRDIAGTVIQVITGTTGPVYGPLRSVSTPNAP